MNRHDTTIRDILDGDQSVTFIGLTDSALDAACPIGYTVYYDGSPS